MSSYNDFVLKERLEPTKGSMYGTATVHEVTHTHTRLYKNFSFLKIQSNGEVLHVHFFLHKIVNRKKDILKG